MTTSDPASPGPPPSPEVPATVEPSATQETLAADVPVHDRYRSNEPSDPAEIRRKLLFGVALLLSLGSVYAGLLGWGRGIQYGLAGLAVTTVLVALVSGAAAPPSWPGTGSGRGK